MCRHYERMHGGSWAITWPKKLGRNYQWVRVSEPIRPVISQSTPAKVIFYTNGLYPFPLVCKGGMDQEGRKALTSPAALRRSKDVGGSTEWRREAVIVARVDEDFVLFDPAVQP